MNFENIRGRRKRLSYTDDTELKYALREYSSRWLSAACLFSFFDDFLYNDSRPAHFRKKKLLLLITQTNSNLSMK